MRRHKHSNPPEKAFLLLQSIVVFSDVVSPVPLQCTAVASYEAIANVIFYEVTELQNVLSTF